MSDIAQLCGFDTIKGGLENAEDGLPSGFRPVFSGPMSSMRKSDRNGPRFALTVLPVIDSTELTVGSFHDNAIEFEQEG